MESRPASHLTPFTPVPASHQDPSCKVLSISIAHLLEQVSSSVHQGGFIQFNAAE